MVTSQPVFFWHTLSLWTAGQWQTSRLGNLAYWERAHKLCVCVRVRVCVRAYVYVVCVRICIIWAWYRSRGLYNLFAPHRLIISERWVGSWLLCIVHGAIWSGQILLPGRCFDVPRHRVHLLDRGAGVEEQGGRDREDKVALVFQETPPCQSISGWRGSREKHAPKHIVAQQAVTCACTTIYTVIRT